MLTKNVLRETLSHTETHKTKKNVFFSPVAQPPLKTEGSPSSSTEESMNEEHPPIPVAHILKRNPLDLKYVFYLNSVEFRTFL